MKKVLVTGGCGFIGSHLVDYLVKRGDTLVYVIDNMDTGKKENCNHSEKVKYFFKDIRDIFSDEKMIQEFEGIEVVYHLAALARIQPSFGRPCETVDVNVRGTTVVCDLARKLGARVVYAGSSSYYGGVYLNPYSFTKWQGEEICKMYSEVYGLNTAIARFFNVYGVRHPKEGPYGTIVGIFERQFVSNEPLTVTGTGDQRRDFTHVSDIVTGLCAMAQIPLKGDVYNLGTGTNHSINELASLYGTDRIYIPARPGEAWVTLADISKTKEELKWAPKQTLKEYVTSWVNKNGKQRLL